MRRGQKPELIYDTTRPSGWPGVQAKSEGDKGLLLGVNLSADFCAEHEWGIARLKAEFGIPDVIGIYGIARRRITRIPPGLAWVEFKSTYFMGKSDVEAGRAKKAGDAKFSNAGFVYHSWYGEEPMKLAMNSELRGFGLRGAWSDQDFGVVSSNRDDIEALRDIFAEFQRGNAVLTFANSMPAFENPGLILGVADRIPALVLEQWYNADKDYHEVRLEFEATGIEEVLKKAGKRYFALSPRRQEDGTLRFWLNPYEQRRDNYGWFSLQDLRDWAENRGPIPMSKVT